jgi:hypothetical protein
LNLPANLRDMLVNYLKVHLKISGDNNDFVEDHMTTFQDCIDNLVVEHEDVAIL